MQTTEEIQNCVKRASDLYLSGDKITSLDIIFDTFDDLMHAGRFDTISLIHKSTDLKSTASAVLLSVIINTRFALSKIEGGREFSLKAIAELESRPDFDKRATANMKAELHNKEPIKSGLYEGGFLHYIGKFLRRAT